MTQINETSAIQPVWAPMDGVGAIEKALNGLHAGPANV